MSTTDEPQAPRVEPITRQDKRALASADSVVFRLYQGQATIEANLDAARSSTGFDEMHTIHCSASVLDYSAEGSTVREPADYQGFHMEHSGVKYNDDLRSIVSRIAVGDSVRLAWQVNSSGNLRESGWVRDELRLVLTNDKGKHETYIVDVQVGPDNTARMIKYAPAQYSIA